MLKVSIAKLKPQARQLTGATIGEAHAQSIRRLLVGVKKDHIASVVLDFAGIESATASYLKRVIDPFFAPPGPQGFSCEVSPIAINVKAADLQEDLTAYLAGKRRVLIVAHLVNGHPKLQKLLGQLDRAAAETFDELRALKKATAVQLYERHREETTNQTAWNNRLAQLVDLRIASRNREGRFWIYEPTVNA